MGKYNLSVNAVGPTFIYIPGTEEYLANEGSKKTGIFQDRVGKIGEPKAVANAMLFLASAAASLIAGTTLMVDGE